MKTIKKLLATFFIALLFFSCEKEMTKNNSLGTGGTAVNNERIDPANMEDSMNVFIHNSIEQNHFSNYEARDALLMIEAALNYHTGIPDSDYYEVAKDSITFQIYLVKDQNGEFIFDGDDMDERWPIYLDSAENAVNRVTFDDPNDPFNIVVDLEFTQFDPNSSASSQTATFYVITLVANGPIVLPFPNCEYGTNDYWNAFYQNFTWGCPPNTSTTSTCFAEMYKRLRPVCRGICSGGYFSEISNQWYYGLAPSSAGLTCSPYWLFVTTAYPNPQHCLTPAEMECFTGNCKIGAAFYAPYINGSSTVKKCVISFYLHEMVALCNCPSFHEAAAFYGKPNDLN